MKEARCMESMWRDLPASVLERVFTFLPIACVCRFRTLSKEWNRFISSPSFKQHAGAGSEEEYALITPQWGSLERGWDVLDVARKRYFTLSGAFLIKYFQRQGLLHEPAAIIVYPLLAADGGLFCVRFILDADTSFLLVCNPVLQTVKQLPYRPGWVDITGHEAVVMATDRSSTEYEILIVSTVSHMGQPDSFEPDSIVVYESKTGRWRMVPYQPSGYEIWWDSLTIFNNNHYCIVNRGDPASPGLVSFDTETGVVSDFAGIDFPCCFGSRLVISSERLFCVISDPPVEIFEVDVVKGASTRLTVMPEALLMWVLGEDLKCDVSCTIKVAIGSGDYILVAAIVGRCTAYSLSHESWYQFPDDRTLCEAYSRGATLSVPSVPFYGRNCGLSICAP